MAARGPLCALLLTAVSEGRPAQVFNDSETRKYHGKDVSRVSVPWQHVYKHQQCINVWSQLSL